MKTFGQIAHDKGVEVGGWARRWETMSEMQRREWELIAAAVIDAYKFSVREEPK
jgi:sensor domain CHASE-containing protein